MRKKDMIEEHVDLTFGAMFVLEFHFSTRLYRKVNEGS